MGSSPSFTTILEDDCLGSLFSKHIKQANPSLAGKIACWAKQKEFCTAAAKSVLTTQSGQYLG